VRCDVTIACGRAKTGATLSQASTDAHAKCCVVLITDVLCAPLGEMLSCPVRSLCMLIHEMILRRLAARTAKAGVLIPGARLVCAPTSLSPSWRPEGGGGGRRLCKLTLGRSALQAQSKHIARAAGCVHPLGSSKRSGGPRAETGLVRCRCCPGLKHSDLRLHLYRTLLRR